MQSPFPGMDPYIEARGLWGDFHHGLIGEIDRILAAQVPEKYLVRIGLRSYLRVTRPEGKPVRSSAPRAASDDGAMTMQAFVVEEHRETFIKIYEVEPERRLVTRIEMLSPANKRKKSKGWKKYMRKRQSLLLGSANLVEIDLLRGGQRMPMMGAWPDSPYTLLVCREQRAPYCKVWPAHYREPLPTLPIPLSYPDPDIRIDLQPLIAGIYARSRYDRDIDYGKPLDPPLAEADVAWLAKRLTKR